MPASPPPGLLRTSAALAALALTLPAPPAAGQSQGEGAAIESGTFAPASAAGEEALHQRYPHLASLLDALDAGYARLPDLVAVGGGPEADRAVYDRLLRDVLEGPSDEGGEAFAGLTPRVRTVLERTHALRWRIYDLYAEADVEDPRTEVERAVEEYRSGTGGTLPVDPKEYAITEEDERSGAFADAHPRVAGLLRAHQWLQLAVYEPLILHDSSPARRAGMLAVMARFWKMLEDPPESLPDMTPLAPAIAPNLVREHPRAAAILDNLHLLERIALDVLADPGTANRAAALNGVLEWFRDDTFLSASWYDWNRTAILHGVGSQGGWATGFLPPPDRIRVDYEGHGGHRVIPGMPPGE